MRNILIFTTVAIVLLTTAIFAAAQEPCRTPSGKPCVLLEQAAVAQAQGLEFLGLVENAEIGDILAGVYRFALGLIGISALIMLVFGGVVYMTAADSQDRVKQGQTFMRNAVFGLVLALLSYLILWTINPDITKRLELDLVKIEEAKVEIAPLGGFTELPKEGFVPAGSVEITKQGTCSKLYKLINEKCYPFVSNPPCSPPEFYNHVAGTCHLKREL